MPTGRLPGRSPVWRVAAALLVVLDLLAAAAARLWGVLPVDVLSPLLSIGVVTASDASTAAALLSWLVVAVLLFWASEAVYPAVLGLRDGRPGFKLLFVAFALAYATVVGAAGSSTGFPGEVIAVFLASTIALVAYLRLRTGWNLFGVDGHATAMLRRYVPGKVEVELRRIRSRTGWRRTLAAGLWLLAVGVFLALPAFFAGLAAVVLGRAFPVPDLLVLGVALVGRDGVDGRLYDLERRLYGATGSATRNAKGAVLVTWAVVGAFASATLLSTTFRFVDDVLGVVPATADPLAVWNFLGVSVLLVASALSGLWVWLRELDRLPAFLDYWGGRPTCFGGPSRPVGLTVPPTAAFLGATWFVGRAGDPSARATVAVAWPVLVVLLLGTVPWTLRRPRRPPYREDLAVTAGLVVQYLGIRAWPAVAGPDATTDGLVSAGLLFPPFALFAVTYLHDAMRYAERRRGVAGYADAGYLAAFGVGVGVIGAITGDRTVGALVGLALVAVLGAAAIAATRYLER